VPSEMGVGCMGVGSGGGMYLRRPRGVCRVRRFSFRVGRVYDASMGGKV
jgi:hypothetical protein